MGSEMEKNIYDLGLFESMQIQVQGAEMMAWTVVRVPGGWIIVDGPSSVYIPHFEHLTMAFRAGQPMQEINQTEQQRQKDQEELKMFRPVVQRLYEEMEKYKAFPPGKMYKAEHIGRLLFNILNLSS